MDETRMFVWIMLAGGVISTLSGLMFLAIPQVVRKLNMWISQSVASIDGAIVKHNMWSGVMFLLVGIFLLYMTWQSP